MTRDDAITVVAMIEQGRRIEVATDEPRFWNKVEKGAGCWRWKAGTLDGYGRFRIGGITLNAHRLSYAMVFGQIPSNRVIDHLCRNRACVNPAHLELVTRRENALRGEGVSAQHNRKTHCVNGHALSGTNVRVVPGRRRCLICQREVEARRPARRHG